MERALLITWSSEYETGFELIDKQHIALFEEINICYVKCINKLNRQAIHQCLQFLESYIQFHFQTEEAMQIQSQYPYVYVHQSKHKMLAFEVKRYSLAFNTQTPDEAMVKECFEFIVNWIQEHVKIDDKAFCDYYARR